MTDETETQTEVPTPPPAPKKMISLEKFKSWLEGVEEMQEEDWHPSAAQWKTIRDKFDLIDDTPPPAPAPVQQVAPNVPAGPMPRFQPPAEAAWAPAPATPDVEISPAAKALLEGNGGRTRTPDVDSTDGNFESPFT